MSEEHIQYLPFTSTDELILHLNISQMLIEKLKEKIELMPKTSEIEREFLEDSLVDGLNVLIDGYVNAVLSIQQGYIEK